MLPAASEGSFQLVFLDISGGYCGICGHTFQHDEHARTSHYPFAVSSGNLAGYKPWET